MAHRLQAKSAIVSRSDSGIGQATAEEFVIDGGLMMNVGQGA